MSTKNTAVFGIYATPGTAEAAVDHLLAKGFTNSAISVLLPDDDSTRAFAHEKNTKAPEGTTAGVTAGGVVGGTLGLSSRSRFTRNSRRRTDYRSWPNCGRVSRHWCRRNSRRNSRSAGRDGHSRI